MEQRASEAHDSTPTPGTVDLISPKIVATKQAAEQGRHLSRAEAAAVLGISKSEFIRREDLGIYVPTTINPQGWHLFSMEYLSNLPGYGKERKSLESQSSPVRATRLKEAYAAQGGSNYSPEVAAKIFQALDDGMSSREIVKTLLVHPNTMDAVYEAWIRMATKDGGGIVISAKQMAVINDLPLPGTFPILTSDQLVINMTKASKGTDMCPICKARACQLCAVCAQPEPEQTAAPAPPKKGPGRPKKEG